MNSVKKKPSHRHFNKHCSFRVYRLVLSKNNNYFEVTAGNRKQSFVKRCSTCSDLHANHPIKKLKTPAGKKKWNLEIYIKMITSNVCKRQQHIVNFQVKWNVHRKRFTWESCCWKPLKRGAYRPIVHWKTKRKYVTWRHIWYHVIYDVIYCIMSYMTSHMMSHMTSYMVSCHIWRHIWQHLWRHIWHIDRKIKSK